MTYLGETHAVATLSPSLAAIWFQLLTQAFLSIFSASLAWTFFFADIVSSEYSGVYCKLYVMED